MEFCEFLIWAWNVTKSIFGFNQIGRAKETSKVYAGVTLVLTWKYHWLGEIFYGI